MILDYDLVTTSQIVASFGRHSGGTNYAFELLHSLIESDASEKYDFRILVSEISGQWVKKELPTKRNIKVIMVKNLTAWDFCDTKILFLPQVNGTLLSQIKSIHKMNPYMKIYGTLHDKQHNIEKYDTYDGFFSYNPFWANICGRGFFVCKRIAFYFVYKKNISLFDKVFTVSNYSAQKILSDSLKDIYVYSQTNYLSYKKRYGEIGNYILFVGGGRPEKNLIRTLEAYCLYINDNSKVDRLIVTGVTEDLQKIILRCPKLKVDVLRKMVEFREYVTDDELADLYSNCKYVLFLSKGEGYGLPVLEAMSYGKTVLASRVTSVPEVGGTAVKYVNPYSVESIKRGFEFFSDDSKVLKYSKNAIKRYEILSKNAELDKKIIADEILN